MAQAWCDFEASAETPALTIYNTLEASQAPTLPSYRVGSTHHSAGSHSASALHWALPHW